MRQTRPEAKLQSGRLLVQVRVDVVAGAGPTGTGPRVGGFASRGRASRVGQVEHHIDPAQPHAAPTGLVDQHDRQVRRMANDFGLIKKRVGMPAQNEVDVGDFGSQRPVARAVRVGVGVAQVGQTYNQPAARGWPCGRLQSDRGTSLLCAVAAGLSVQRPRPDPRTGRGPEDGPITAPVRQVVHCRQAVHPCRVDRLAAHEHPFRVPVP